MSKPLSWEAERMNERGRCHYDVRRRRQEYVGSIERMKEEEVRIAHI